MDPLRKNKRNSPLEIVVATRNQGKVREISSILKNSHLQFLSLSDFPEIPEIIEDGVSFVENAQKKALTAACLTGRLAIADDSGLCVQALKGRPGIYSSRFAGENATDEERCQKLLEEMKGIPLEHRKATFICVLAIASPLGKIGVIQGECQGLISLSPRGSYGFGFDPVFLLPHLGKTMAELTPEEKNRISHRARALKKLKKILPAFLTSSCHST